MSLRARLTLGYSAVLAGVLLVFSAALYLLLTYGLVYQLDQTLAQSAETILQTSRVTTQRNLRIITLPSLAFAAPNVYIQVWSSNRQLIASSGNVSSFSQPLDSAALGIEQQRYGEVRIGSAHLRVFTVPITLAGAEAGFLQIGTPLTMVDRIRDSLLLMLVLGDTLGIVVAAALGSLMAGRALRPLDTVTETALQITRADDLSRRLALEAPAGSEVGRLILAFNETLERLEDLFYSQRRFLADVSHELRTPLTAIRGNVDLIRRMGADEESLEAIQTEAERLIRLVGDLLLLAQAETGNLPLAHDPVDVDTVLLEVFQQGRVLAQDHLTLAMGDWDQALVVGDRDRLKQLFLNLVANAVQYTPSGGRVTLSLRLVGEWTHISVTDTGPGIPAEEIPHLFERFYRVDRSRARKSRTGAGLGLSIAYWIAHSHGGRIEVASEMGKGTTFSVWLPLAAKKGHQPAAVSA
ncbi:MAG: ATP-binding protein [Anaerolineales bacterium]|jgi:signal transduction histidine kinase